MDDELSSFQWLQLQLLSFDKYLSALVNNCSITAIGLIAASLLIAIVTWLLTRDEESSQQMIGHGNESTPIFKDSLGKKSRQNSDRPTHSDLRRRKGMQKLY